MWPCHNVPISLLMGIFILHINIHVYSYCYLFFLAFCIEKFKTHREVEWIVDWSVINIWPHLFLSLNCFLLNHLRISFKHCGALFLNTSACLSLEDKFIFLHNRNTLSLLRHLTLLTKCCLTYRPYLVISSWMESLR